MTHNYSEPKGKKICVTLQALVDQSNHTPRLVESQRLGEDNLTCIQPIMVSKLINCIVNTQVSHSEKKFMSLRNHKKNYVHMVDLAENSSRDFQVVLTSCNIITNSFLKGVLCETG